MQNEMFSTTGVLIPIAGIAFVTILIWLTERRKERESLQRNELFRKIAESPGDAAQQVLAMIHQQDEEAQIHRREGTKLAGLIILAAGIGLAIFLALFDRNSSMWAVGLMPIFIGVALAYYASFLAPKTKNSR